MVWLSQDFLASTQEGNHEEHRQSHRSHVFESRRDPGTGPEALRGGQATQLRERLRQLLARAARGQLAQGQLGQGVHGRWLSVGRHEHPGQGRRGESCLERGCARDRHGHRGGPPQGRRTRLRPCGHRRGGARSALRKRPPQGHHRDVSLDR